NDQNGEAVLIDRIDRQRHPVERDRAFWRDEFRKLARAAQLEPGHVRQIVPRHEGGDAVRMAGDDVPAEFVADLQRALEVEWRALPPVLCGGHAERLGSS